MLRFMRATGTVAISLVMLAASAPAAGAETFAVETKKDRLDVSPGDGACGNQAGVCALRAAIAEANALNGIDTIELPRGTFKLTRQRQGTASNDEGDLDLTEAVIIEGKGERKTTIKQTVKDRVVLSNAEPESPLPGAVLNKLTVRGGRVTKPADGSGGGILVEDNLMLLDRVIVRDNTISHENASFNGLGGGLAQMDGQLSLQDSVVSGNDVAGGATGLGGGIYAGASVDSVAITESRISGNTARRGVASGGGLWSRALGTTIVGSTVAGNRATEGGGLYVFGQDADLDLTASTISGNTARLGGGMRYAVADGSAEVTNSTFSGNRSRGNASTTGGAAIHLGQGVLELTHSTLADNQPEAGDATLEIDGTIGPPGTMAELRGSVFDDPRRECVAPPGFITMNEVNVYQDDSCIDATLSSNLVADPKLKPLAANPGPTPAPVTETHALKASSPAVDFVTSACPPPATDQVGWPRPQGGFCDAGSREAPG